MELALYSRFVQRIRRRYCDYLGLLPPGAPCKLAMVTTLAALRAEGLDLGAALRILRQLVIERLVVLDCDTSQTDEVRLNMVTSAMTELAELALSEALHCSNQALDAAQEA